jgi:hypothetical protein
MGADNVDTPPSSADSPLPGSDNSLGGPDAGPHPDEGTPATDLGLPLADSPLAGTGPFPGGPDTGLYRDEGTPGSDAANSPATTDGPDHPAPAPAADEGHALTNETGPSADGSTSWFDKTKHVAKHGAAIGAAMFNVVTTDVASTADVLTRVPPAEVSRVVVNVAENVGRIGDAVDETRTLGTEISDVVRGETGQPGTGGGAAEHPATEPDPEIPVDRAPDPAGPGDPDSPDSDDAQTILGQEADREKENTEAEKAALESRQPDRFPRPQNSPKISDQVRDRRPTPTGRGGSRGRPK